jgi:predicted CxxxxCH...CXXCH cytochrome family protein
MRKKLFSVIYKESTMERYDRVGYIKTTVVFMLISLSMLLLATGTVSAAPQYSIGCSSCHGMPPLDAASGKDPVTGAVEGNHQTHSTDQSAACNKCHGNSGYPTDHRDGVVNFKANINDSPATAQYRNGAFVNHTSMPILGSCSSVNCHFESITPAWGSTTPINCGSCHGAAPQTGSHPGYNNSKHGIYLGTDTTSCVKCHPSHATFTHASSAGKRGITVQFTTSPNSGGTYAGGSTAYPNYLPSQSPAHNGTCSNIYCHSNGQSGAPATVPTWGSSLPADCSGCHGTKDVNATTLSGAHNKHLNDASNGGKFNCIDCHNLTVSNNTTISDVTRHVNGGVDFAGANAGSNKNCSNIYCHSNGKGTYAAIPAWTGTSAAGCELCHGFNNLGQSHEKHLAKYSNTSCNYCHSTTTSTGTQISGTTHINNAVDVWNGGSVTFTFTGGTCSTISCHGGYSANWGSTLNCESCHPKTGLSGKHTVHMGALNVTTQVTFYNFTANRSPASSDATRQYGFGCASCHPLDKATYHMNGFADVSLGNIAGVGTLRTKNGASAAYNGDKTCSQVYCHSDGYNTPSSTTVAWNTSFSGDRCAQCHGNSPTTNAHSLHVVGIHYDDIYNGVSGKLKAGASGDVSHGVGSRATTLNCNMCHVNTVSSPANDQNTVCASCHDGVKATHRGDASIANLSFHVNGKADITFNAVKVVSKAQLRPASFNSYTASWVRNGAAYKSYSAAYDTAKYPLATATMWAPGAQKGQGTCSNVSCHVGNTVQWNATLTCDSCHTRL